MNRRTFLGRIGLGALAAVALPLVGTTEAEAVPAATPIAPTATDPGADVWISEQIPVGTVPWLGSQPFNGTATAASGVNSYAFLTDADTPDEWGPHTWQMTSTLPFRLTLVTSSTSQVVRRVEYWTGDDWRTIGVGG